MASAEVTVRLSGYSQANIFHRNTLIYNIFIPIVKNVQLCVYWGLNRGKGARSMHPRRVVCSLAGAVCAALSTHVEARDVRACLTIRDLNQRIECFEGRTQPSPETLDPLPAPNFSPSFPCEDAATRIERLICNDSVLAQLDAQMGRAYFQALKNQNNSATLVDEQRRWLASRDSGCGTVDSARIRVCLTEFTTARIARLASLPAIQRELPPEPPAAGILPDASPASEPVIVTDKSTVKIVPDPAGVTQKREVDSQLVVDEATASKLLIERVQSLLRESPTQNVKFFTYSVDKKQLRDAKSDMPLLRVVYEERVFFDTDKANLRPEALPIVKSLAITLKQQKQKVTLFVAGHTDARGSDEYNLNLSIRRAEAVARALKKEGSGTALIWRVGFGKAIPIRPNNSVQNMALNRRVEFLIASQAEVITTWIKNTKVCEDEACGTTSVVSSFQAAPISDQGAKPINIELPAPKPVEIELEFHPIEIGPPLK
jgi:outer membrane protein OmpA-like peptidoglycan-associated protein/uncharacterized protein YecT (DUF1311 family)